MLLPDGPCEIDVFEGPLPRFEPSRELFLLDGWFGSAFGADAPDDLDISLLPVDAPLCAIGVVGEVALAAAEVLEETPDEIDPLAVCVEVGAEYGEETAGLWPGRGEAAMD